MSPVNPIEFMRRLVNNKLQHAGNRVQLEDPNGVHYDVANPLPVQAPPGALLGTVGIDQVTANANHVEDVLLNTVLGAVGDAAVVTDANGTISAKLRGLIKLIIGGLSVKGTGFSIPVTLTVTNGAYTVADAVGGLITFAGAASAAGKRSVIHTITLAGVAALEYELWFFPADITTPAADNAAFTLVAADVAACKGVIPISSSDYKAPQSAFNVATLRSVGFEYTCVATTLYAYLKAVAVTSPGTTTLTLTIKGEFID